MTTSIVSNAVTKQVWESDFTAEYVRQSGFLAYMGTDEGSIIRVRTKLMNEAGNLIHFTAIPKLSSAGVTGGTNLRGAEEQLKNYSYAIRTGLARNGVMVPRSESFKSEIDLLNAGKTSLRNWAAARTRDNIVAQLQSVVVKGAAASDGTPGEDSNVLWASATATNKDLFLDNNADRVCFGANRPLSTTAPAGGAVHSMSNTLLTVAATDKMSAAILGIAKRKAKKTTNGSNMAITPYNTDATNGREFFVLFVDSNGFRDLSNDTAILNANLQARPRELDGNPLFQDGDLLYQGIIIKEIASMPTLGAVGASSAVVGTAFLCGAEAIGIAYSQKPTARTDVRDYDLEHGVAIEVIDGFGKIAYNGVQNGVVSIFYASTDD